MTEQQPIKRAKRKRGTGAPSKMYFHAGTQAAIVAYQNSTCSVERNRLYATEIHPAFLRLCENLINIHKFTSLHDTFEDLRNDCINFLFETLLKFDATRGTAAFSYFNVCAKNFLIIRTKKKVQATKRILSIDDPESLNNAETMMVEDHYNIPSQDIVLENASTAREIINLLYIVRGMVTTENELVCVNSIITVFENIHDIDFVNKTAIMMYMKELSSLSSKQLTTTLQTIKKLYKEIKDEDDPELPFDTFNT